MLGGARGSVNDRARIAESYNRLYSQFTSEELIEVGNYSIIRPIGEGAFGKVYLATHRLTRTKVVLKTGTRSDPNIVREVFYHRQFEHPHITRLYEVIVSEGLIWMVLEYCPGKELYDYVLGCGRVPLVDTKRLFSQITSAVFYAHSMNCIHRDLKLENILLDKKKHNAKLSDFGFTRECEQRNYLQTICGTTVYMAPELLKKERYDGFKVDIWSLGVILYTMLYGQMPFDEDDETTTKYKIINDEPIYRDDLPVEAIELIKKLLDKDPTERPTTLEILQDPFLETYGSFLFDSTHNILKNSASQRYFHSKNEKHLLKKLKNLGVDIQTLEKSVMSKKCDSLCGLWQLLLEKERKKEARKYKTRSRSVLRISESTSRRVSQLIEPNTTQQLRKIISGDSFKSTKTTRSNHFSQHLPTIPNSASNHTTISSPEKKKNGFIQKFSKLWKVNKKPDFIINGINHNGHLQNNHADLQYTSHDIINNNQKKNVISSDDSPNNNSDNKNLKIINPTSNDQQTSASNNKKLTVSKMAIVKTDKIRPNKLIIEEPRSPIRSPGAEARTPRPRPLSMLSQYSMGSQFTTMSDLSVLSHTTSLSDAPQRPTFTRKISSDTSLHSRNTARRSLSLISSNSSNSEKSSAKASLYDHSSSDFSRVWQRHGRYNNDTIFPAKRGKSPRIKLQPSSKFKRSRAYVIQEEGDDDDLEAIDTDLENLGITSESTRNNISDFEEEFERGRKL